MILELMRRRAEKAEAELVELKNKADYYQVDTSHTRLVKRLEAELALAHSEASGIGAELLSLQKEAKEEQVLAFWLSQKQEKEIERLKTELAKVRLASNQNADAAVRLAGERDHYKTALCCIEILAVNSECKHEDLTRAYRLAVDALAGTQPVQEACRTLPAELRDKIEKTMTDHWDMKACECLTCEAGRVLKCGPRDKYLPHKQKRSDTETHGGTDGKE